MPSCTRQGIDRMRCDSTANLQGDLEHDALIRAPANIGCAKDVSLSIDAHAAVGISAVVAAREVVKVGKVPGAVGRSHLEDRAVTVCGLAVGKTVDAAASQRKFVVRSAVTADKAVDGGKDPAGSRRRHFIDRASAVDPAIESRAVQITGLV